MKRQDWDKIRFEMTTKQLIKMSKERQVDISDIPLEVSSTKRKIARRLAEKVNYRQLKQAACETGSQPV